MRKKKCLKGIDCCKKKDGEKTLHNLYKKGKENCKESFQRKQHEKRHGKCRVILMEMKPCLDGGCRQVASKRRNGIKTKG